MAGKGVSYIRWRKPSGRCFMTALSSALLEWLLITMLLINDVFAYLITWFARYCDLPIPCLLCSRRLDHVFGTRSMRSYWDLMCRSHRSEISSLVLCTHHEKLVDVHGMCENCLFSFATKDKSNSATYRLLVGKLGLDSDNDADDSPLIGDQKHPSRGTKVCCCCNEPWSSRSHAQALLQTKYVELERDDVDANLPRELRLNWNGLDEKRAAAFGLMKIYGEDYVTGNFNGSGSFSGLDDKEVAVYDGKISVELVTLSSNPLLEPPSLVYWTSNNSLTVIQLCERRHQD